MQFYDTFHFYIFMFMFINFHIYDVMCIPILYLVWS